MGVRLENVKSTGARRRRRVRGRAPFGRFTTKWYIFGSIDNNAYEYSSDNRSRGSAPVARVFVAARRHRQVARRKRGRTRIRDIMAVSDV